MKIKRVSAVLKTAIIAARKPPGRRWKLLRLFRSFAAHDCWIVSASRQFGRMRAKEDPVLWQKAMRSRCVSCSFSRLSPWQGERTKVRGSEAAAPALLNYPPPLPGEGRGDPRARSDSRRADHSNSDATRLP